MSTTFTYLRPAGRFDTGSDMGKNAVVCRLEGSTDSRHPDDDYTMQSLKDAKHWANEKGFAFIEATGSTT